MNTKKVLVTGAAGFIGFHTATKLLRENLDVIALDNLSRGSRRKLELLEKMGAETLVGDIRDRNLICRVLRDCDAVVHLAALISVEESFEVPDEYVDVNTRGTAVISRCCADNNVDRIVYASTAAVYGEPKELPVKEDHPLDPLSPYGVSKLAGEQILLLIAEKSDTSCIVLRLFNVYGPGQDPGSPYSGVITRFVVRALKGEPLIVYGDGFQTRDFVYVEDVVEAIMLSLRKKITGVFNIGSGKPTSILELAEQIGLVLGRQPRIIHAPPRPGDIRYSYACLDKAREKLGFQPKIQLREGLEKLITSITEKHEEHA